MNITSATSSLNESIKEMGNLLKEIAGTQNNFQKKMIGVAVENNVKSAQLETKKAGIDLFA